MFRARDLNVCHQLRNQSPIPLSYIYCFTELDWYKQINNWQKVKNPCCTITSNLRRLSDYSRGKVRARSNKSDFTYKYYIQVNILKIKKKTDKKTRSVNNMYIVVDLESMHRVYISKILVGPRRMFVIILCDYF